MNKLIDLAKDITVAWNNQNTIPSPYKYLKEKGYKKDEIKLVVEILKEANKNMISSIKRNPEAYGMKPIEEDELNMTWGK